MTDQNSARDGEDCESRAFTISRRGMLGVDAAALVAAVTAAGCDAKPDGSAAEEITKSPIDPSEKIIDQQRAAQSSMPFGDTTDFADTDRGFLAKLEPGVVRDAKGNVVWESDSYRFLRVYFAKIVLQNVFDRAANANRRTCVWSVSGLDRSVSAASR
jgi:alkyl sulfatase BDS1-like metallo-beta-lactamase superfamily hydrolase